MKGVEDCDKLGGLVKRELIPILLSRSSSSILSLAKASHSFPISTPLSPKLPVMPILQFARDEASSSDDDNSSKLTPTYIAGIVVISVLVLGLAIWLIVRQIRIRANRRRKGVAFVSPGGPTKNGNEKDLPESVKGTFSRSHLTQSVVLPDKVLIRPSPSAPPAEIIDYHRESGNLPRPFSFALNAGTEGPPRPQSNNNRGSWISFLSASGSGPSRFSVMSSSSTVDSTRSSGTNRKIRQGFSPVLPDELLVSVGEKLTVVQSFDDGWCVVARDGGNTFAQAKSLFKPAESQSNVEMGVVPEWCFLKPVVGLKGERPIRSTSLGITVQMERPGFSSREELMSWSNF
jgi:hypothetical protein